MLTVDLILLKYKLKPELTSLYKSTIHLNKKIDVCICLTMLSRNRIQELTLVTKNLIFDYLIPQQCDDTGVLC